MKAMSVVLGVLTAATAVAIPTESQSGVHVDVGIVLGAPRYGPGYVRGYDASRYGYDRGFRAGLEYGSVAVGRGLAFDVSCNRDVYFGYDGWMGPRYEYGSGFRRGYEAGYRQSFGTVRIERYDRGHDRGNRYDRRDRDDRRGRDRNDRYDRDHRDRNR